MSQTNIQKVVTALASEATDLEAAFQQLLLNRSLDTAIGAQLDLIGKLVGLARAGLDDDTYRRYIRAQIITNNSTGKTEDLIAISVLILNDVNATIHADTMSIASVVVTIAGTAVTTAIAQILYSFLFRAKAAGVKLWVVYSIVAPSITFTYDGTGAQAYDNGHYAGVIP